MKHASLVAFLSGTLAPEALMEEIASEVADFYTGLREIKHGSILISDGALFVVTRSAVRRFLSFVSTRQLSSDAAVYVADCLVASDDIEFEDEVARDAIFFLEDDSARFVKGRNDLWTPDEISKVLASLD